MIYLASPYSHIDREIEQERYEAVRGVVAHFTPRYREPIFSPIVYCHELARNHGMSGTFAGWRHFNFSMLRISNELWVLQLPGWNASKGVTSELMFAHEAGITVRHMEPNGSFIV